MEYKKTERGIEIKIGKCFDLKNTFDCGQCFRWNENADGSFSGIVGKKYAKVFRDGDFVVIENATESDYKNIWENYFDLETCYDDIRKEIVLLDSRLECAVESINGMRILNQNAWEALCSFIISQNNNIPRIKGIVERLCENFGDKIENGYTFPSAERIAKLSVDDLAPLRAGFRARYIIDASRKVSSGEIDIEKMHTADMEECRKDLMKITGVGAKVAECTLLYGFHRLEAFPVDVWIKKALATFFNGISPENLGQYAGIAQQYIFHYSRLNPELVQAK